GRDRGNSHGPRHRVRADRPRSMRWGRTRSLQLRLVARVAALYIPLTVIAILVLMTRAYETVRSIGDDELMDRALALATSLPPPSSGSAEFDVSLGSLEFQEAAHAAGVFAIRDRTGRLLAASPVSFSKAEIELPDAESQPGRFSIEDFGANHENYSGIT